MKLVLSQDERMQMNRLWRVISGHRWYLLLGGCFALATVGDTYDLVVSGFRPNYYWPYWYSTIFLGLFIGYWKRYRIIAFLQDEFRPTGSDNQD